MAGITQTIDTYYAGVSQQPDFKKFPGQVTSIVNGVPDVIEGLYKRPGSKRISPATGQTNHDDPLPTASTSTEANTWFHYYRDETEGSYIGEVTQAGRVKIWSCKDGVKQDVIYAAELWTASTEYSVDDRVQKGLNIYTCITAGTSAGSGGPSGTGTSITDNTVKWKYTETASDAKDAIYNYLTPSTVDGALQVEDLQVLTINDTTFLNNRSKVVATSGVTSSRPHTNYAFIEVLRSENGRQYALNLHNTTDTTNSNRATMIEIAGDDLDEGEKTGTCRGIGTQVFSVNRGTGTGHDLTNAKNLVFRITVQGQQGQRTGYEDNDGVPASPFACSYSRDITLLHGGEGWETSFTLNTTSGPGSSDERVELTNAAGGNDQNNTGSTKKAKYKIRIKKHENVVQKTYVAVDGVTATEEVRKRGMIRPMPTPFDADTAVSIDTILGGVVAEINKIKDANGNSVINSEIIGNGLYLYSDTVTFNVDVLDRDLMRVMQSEVNDVSKLPNQCYNGYIVKVSNSQNANDDDYYLKFEGEQGRNGVGSWVECAAPGIVKSLTDTKMPHVLQRVAINAGVATFLVRKHYWADREVGDDNTNALPSFVGNTINKVLFHRNRLAFLSGENVILSEPGELAKPNFFAKTGLAVSAVDPIDISSSSIFPSDLFDGIEINTGLLVFSTNQQFLLSSDAEILNPDTAKLRSISTYNYNKNIPPVSLGVSIGYIDNSGKYSRFNEMINAAREGEPTVVETSSLVPTFLPKKLDILTNSRENGLVLFGRRYTDNTNTPNSDIVYGYKYIQSGEERPQTAWFKWKFNTPIKYHFIIDDDYYFLDKDNFLQTISLKQKTADPSIDQDGVNYLINLDNWTTVTNGVYNEVTNKTTFTNQSDWIDQVITPNGSLVVIDIDANATRIGKYAQCTVEDSDDFTLPGDWSTGTFYIGYLYDYQVEFPKFHVSKTEGKSSKSDINSSMIIHRVKLAFGKSGLYSTTLKRLGKPDYTNTHESTLADEYDANDAPYLPDQQQTIPVYEKSDNVNLILKSSHPGPASLNATIWEGDYSNKYYKIV